MKPNLALALALASILGLAACQTAQTPAPVTTAGINASFDQQYAPRLAQACSAQEIGTLRQGNSILITAATGSGSDLAGQAARLNTLFASVTPQCLAQYRQVNYDFCVEGAARGQTGRANCEALRG